MNKKYSYLLAAGMAVFIIFGIYYFVREEQPISQSAKPTQAAQPASRNMSFSGNTLVEEKDGKVQWEISALKAEADGQSQETRLSNISGILHQADGSKVTMKAEQATMDMDTRDIVMRGNVYVKSTGGNGTELQVDQLRWSSAQRRFYGTGGVVVQYHDSVMTGQHLESDEKLEKVSIRGDASIKRRG